MSDDAVAQKTGTPWVSLHHPFAGVYPITQEFAHIASFEPLGYLYPDHTVGYTPKSGASLDHYHNGIDYALPCGTPLLAPAPGTVIFAGWDTTGFGNCVKIDHGFITTLVGHLSEIDVYLGGIVTDSQTIGKSGTTGNSTGCHLHWSCIDSQGNYHDPGFFLNSKPAPHNEYPSVGIQRTDGITFVDFTAKTQPGLVRSFDGPSTRCTPIGKLDPDLLVSFNAWMRGESRPDATTGKNDTRWYHIDPAGKTGMYGWVASARVTGNAPGSTP